jgi:hypothetical protein
LASEDAVPLDDGAGPYNTTGALLLCTAVDVADEVAVEDDDGAGPYSTTGADDEETDTPASSVGAGP